MEKKCWYQISKLQNKVGIITDVFLPDFVEIFCEERKKYLIKHITKIEIIC